MVPRTTSLDNILERPKGPEAQRNNPWGQLCWKRFDEAGTAILTQAALLRGVREHHPEEPPRPNSVPLDTFA